jgi:hypothetical protein
MEHISPDPIRNLPEADIPLDGIRAYLSQAQDHQLIFMQFEKDVDLPEHSHAAQVGFVLNGKIDLIIDGIKREYQKSTSIIFLKVLFIPVKSLQDMLTLHFLMNLIAIARKNSNSFPLKNNQYTERKTLCQSLTM